MRKVSRRKNHNPKLRFHNQFFLGFMGMALLVAAGHSWSQDRPLRVYFLNVGYGDAIVIQFPDNTAVLMDAGPGTAEENTADGESGSLKAWPAALDGSAFLAGIVTHPHANHFGGFYALRGQHSPQKIYINGDEHSEEGWAQLLRQWQDRGIPVKILRRGDTIEGLPEGARMDVLHPGDLAGNANANSMVVRLRYKKCSFLFLADIEPPQQEQLTDLYPDLAHADVVKIPHHGGPMSENFGRFFGEKIFIISTGPNPWGIPRDEDLKKLSGVVYRTDRHGTIVVECDGRGLRVRTERE